jgi:hypothetical protein
MVYCEHDKIVDVTEALSVFDRFGSTRKSRCELPEARRHILAGDILAPYANESLKETILDFLADVLPDSGLERVPEGLSENLTQRRQDAKESSDSRFTTLRKRTATAPVSSSR